MIMKSKKQLIEELIEDVRRGLIMDETNKEYIEIRSREHKSENEFETQKQIAEFQMSINSRTYQLEILNRMLKEKI